jgi:hypothetical protein
MALNPVILENGVPEVTVGETFLLSRGGIMFSVKAKEAGKFTGKGVMYLTSHSLFFVCEKPVLTRGISFSSFRIPITSLSDEKFNQPIFGANNLSGRVTPVVGAEQGLSDWTFAFYFKNGGCGTFLPLFFMAMERGRQNTNQFAVDLQTEIANGSIARRAFVDPNDPTVIYVQGQPG